MEKKFILKSSGEPVEIGSVITLHTEIKTPYGIASETRTFPITEDNIDSLIKDDIIAVKKKPTKRNPKKAPNSIEPYIEGLASTLNWKYDKVASYLNKLTDIYAPATFSILLKIIAKRLDKNYEDHISNADEIWVVSLLNGSVGKVSKEGIKNYDNFAAFRSKEDAEFALNILAPYIKYMYGE